MNTNRDVTCCISGHRDLSEACIPEIGAQLRKEILSSINNGYTHFISGFANGVDLIFAKIVADLKIDYNITLEAAIPYKSRMNTSNKDFQQLIRHCDKVTICSEFYTKGCFMTRNRYMIDHSHLLIAVYDGRAKGGTASTIIYANKSMVETEIINISAKPESNM